MHVEPQISRLLASINGQRGASSIRKERHADKNKMTAQNGRQKFARLGVRWTVQIFESSERPAISSETDNVSSDGFYFRTRERFSPGEELQCLVLIPAFDPALANRNLDLRCRVRVMAVEVLDGDKGFGVECHIESYSFSGTDQHGGRCSGG